ncbi:MAG: ABC transporter substrate-binding protein [Tannerellaceae bacterium]|jgi:iron complex transport system substrate-binding protein|nr:ABC transporter substrate-binding protein [Tannerellaceae bacterium]
MRIFGILSLVLSFFLLSACIRQPKNSNVRAVEDMLWRTVMIPEKVERIVGIRAGSLRLLVYMNLAKNVVGIEDGDKLNLKRPYLSAFPELDCLPRIGPLMGGDAELIINARPDVIFTAYSTVGEADDLQLKTGIPVIALECPELGISAARDSLYASLRLIGSVMQREERADSLITAMEEMIHELELRSSVAEARRPSVYVGGVAYGAMKDIASTQPYYPPFIFTKANNVVSSIDRRLVSHVKGTYVDKEQLMVWNPDYLFIDESGLSLILEDLKPGRGLYENLDAVSRGNVFTLMPYNNYAVNYELVLINCWFTGKILYPEAFADMEIDAKANDILKLFFGKPVFSELVTENSFRHITKDDLR